MVYSYDLHVLHAAALELYPAATMATATVQPLTHPGDAPILQVHGPAGGRRSKNVGNYPQHVPRWDHIRGRVRSAESDEFRTINNQFPGISAVHGM